MKILFVTAEMSPYAKVGGLADVAGSLPAALAKLGHDVRSVLPNYRMVEANSDNKLKTKFRDLKVSINPWWHKRATVLEAPQNGTAKYFIGTDEWFQEVENSEQIYTLGVDAYLFFARAALQLCQHMDWIPDIIHCNDWHTGFLPVMLREQAGPRFSATGSLFTIHNLAYQGEFGIDVLDRAGLSRELFDHHRLETYGAVNFLKSGCVYADAVNAVSETYAQEIQGPELGCRLDGVMRFLAENGRLRGIVNGIDQQVWNPATDPTIAANFDVEHLSSKKKCRNSLFKALNWEPRENVPIAGIVSRLSNQKGIHLLFEAADQIASLPIQIVVQGLGDPWIANKMRELEQTYPNTFKFAQKFDLQLAQHIYSGADMFLMPSAYEPCGLGQLIAMRYGTIPVVRATGGLKDTVSEFSPANNPTGNGLTFENLDAQELTQALDRAVRLYRNAPQWEQLVRNAMLTDSSWETSAKKYEDLYMRCILARRSGEAIAS